MKEINLPRPPVEDLQPRYSLISAKEWVHSRPLRPLVKKRKKGGGGKNTAAWTKGQTPHTSRFYSQPRTQSNITSTTEREKLPEPLLDSGPTSENCCYGTEREQKQRKERERERERD